ncbi:MAG: preprotein translocase subunit YajC [Eubacterium sp.]|jgi:preprotein translocase subunit YajC|nr:preprotein translocase subunit YajC [Eubacterium sp.]MCI2196647.1 preprotein translocase subunit YajC [Eubacterium sp.]
MLNTAMMLAAANRKNSWVSTIIMLVIFFALMYFLMIRPQKKKEKEQQEMRSALQKGDEVVTIGGIVGTVNAVKKDGNIVIEVGSNRTKMEVMPWGISKTLTKKKGASSQNAARQTANKDEDGERTGNKGLKMLKKKEPEKKEELAPKQNQQPKKQDEQADTSAASESKEEETPEKSEK